MAKRIAVRFIGGSRCLGLQDIPTGTTFKAVVCAGVPDGVYIRGSSLAKVTTAKDAFRQKQYLFITGRSSSEFEVVL